MTTGPTPREFSDVLRDELHQRGLTHKGLAVLVRVSENSVSSWTTGQYKPRHPRMELIANALNLTIDELHGLPASAPAQEPPTPLTASAAQAPTTHDEAQRIVAALAALDLEAAVEAVQRAAPPLMDILAAARRHVAGT